MRKVPHFAVFITEGKIKFVCFAKQDPCRTVKQEQEEIYRNHVQTFIFPSVQGHRTGCRTGNGNQLSAAPKQSQGRQSNQLLLTFPPFPVRHPVRCPCTKIGNWKWDSRNRQDKSLVCKKTSFISVITLRPRPISYICRRSHLYSLGATFCGGAAAYLPPVKGAISPSWSVRCNISATRLSLNSYLN